MHRRIRCCQAALVAMATLALCQPARAQVGWTGTWGAAPSPAVFQAGSLQTSTTLRQVVHVSRGGSEVRVTFTNELGTDPLVISGAHLGLRSQGGNLVPGSDKALAFGGQPAITLPPGAVAVSDPVQMQLKPLTDLAITMLLPAQPLHVITQHDLGLQTNFQVQGDQLIAATLTDAKPFGSWRFLKNVEVEGGAAGAAIVTLGDSITDGYRSTTDTNRRWPDVLAQRLQADRSLSGTAVVNEGISGNRILHDKAGPNALARFDRDVLSQSGVRYLVVLEGINDIGRTDQPMEPGDPVTVQQIVVAYQQMIQRAHAHGIRVYGATLTPFTGAGYASPAGEAMRQEVNTWIRAKGHFDGVIDFDKVTRNPANPGVFLPAMDSGDHLHPGDAGYQAMGDSIDLKLFRP